MESTVYQEQSIKVVLMKRWLFVVESNEMLEYLKQAENKEYKRLVPQIIVVLYTGPKENGMVLVKTQ